MEMFISHGQTVVSAVWLLMSFPDFSLGWGLNNRKPIKISVGILIVRILGQSPL